MGDLLSQHLALWASELLPVFQWEWSGALCGCMLNSLCCPRPAQQCEQCSLCVLSTIPASSFSSREAVLQVLPEGPDPADRAGGRGLPGEVRKHPAPHGCQRSLGYPAPGHGLHDAHWNGGGGIGPCWQMPAAAAQLLWPQAVLQRAQHRRWPRGSRGSGQQAGACRAELHLCQLEGGWLRSGELCALSRTKWCVTPAGKTRGKSEFCSCHWSGLEGSYGCECYLDMFFYQSGIIADGGTRLLPNDHWGLQKFCCWTAQSAFCKLSLSISINFLASGFLLFLWYDTNWVISAFLHLSYLCFFFVLCPWSGGLCAQCSLLLVLAWWMLSTSFLF